MLRWAGRCDRREERQDANAFVSSSRFVALASGRFDRRGDRAVRHAQGQGRLRKLAGRQARHGPPDQAAGFAAARRHRVRGERFARRAHGRPAPLPQVPPGFKIELFAEGLSGPRIIRAAPNGDIFVAETRAGRIRVLRAADGAAKPSDQRDFCQRSSRARSASRSFRAATTRNGSMSPTPTASCAFPIVPAI